MTQMSPPPESDLPNTSEFRMDSDRLSQVSLWSMILGILFLCLGPLGLVPLVMGIVGIIKTSGGKMRGMGFAIAGTALGSIGLLGGCLWIGIMLPAIGAARQTAMVVLSQSRMRQIQLGMQSYASDHNGQLPPADNWQPVLSEYLVGEPDDPIFDSPLSDGDSVEYVFVPGTFTFDDSQIMFYEDPDHLGPQGMVNVIYDGGTVAQMTEAELEALLEARGHVMQR